MTRQNLYEGNDGPAGNSNSFLNNLTDSWQSSIIDQIEGYTQVSGSNTTMRDGIKMEAKIVTRPPSWYRMGN